MSRWWHFLPFSAMVFDFCQYFGVFVACHTLQCFVVRTLKGSLGFQFGKMFLLSEPCCLSCFVLFAMTFQEIVCHAYNIFTSIFIYLIIYNVYSLNLL